MFAGGVNRLYLAGFDQLRRKLENLSPNLPLHLLIN